MARCDAPPRQQGYRGFAYLWLLITVAVMGVAMSAVAQLDSMSTRRDQEKQLIEIGHQFRAAIGRYYLAASPRGEHEYPLALEDLLQDKRQPGRVRYLRKIFVDPLTLQTQWGLVTQAGRITGVHSMSNKRPIKQDGFEPQDKGLQARSSYRQWVFVYAPDAQAERGGDAMSKEADDDQER